MDETKVETLNEVLIEKVYKLKCADCPTKKEYPSLKKAQEFGWAIAHGGKKCYCPACAFKHRNTGCGGAKKTSTGEQIKISEVQSSA